MSFEYLNPIISFENQNFWLLQLDEDDPTVGKWMILNSKLAVSFTLRKFAEIFKITRFSQNYDDSVTSIFWTRHFGDFQMENNIFGHFRSFFE